VEALGEHVDVLHVIVPDGDVERRQHGEARQRMQRVEVVIENRDPNRNAIASSAAERREANPSDARIAVAHQGYETVGRRVLPDWYAGTGGPPGGHRLFIAAGPLGDPVQEFEGQRARRRRRDATHGFIRPGTRGAQPSTSFATVDASRSVYRRRE